MTAEKRFSLLLAASPDLLKQVDALLSGNHTITETAIPRIYSRAEAGGVLGVSAKRIDQLVVMGALKKTYAPGTSRALGITHASLHALATGRGQEGEVPA